MSDLDSFKPKIDATFGSDHNFQSDEEGEFNDILEDSLPKE
jgi:hypothetical protein